MSDHHANHAPETSHSSSHGASHFGRKEWLGTAAAVGGFVAFPQEVMGAIHSTAGYVQGALDMTTGAIATGANTAGASFVGSLAPLAAPAAAGYYIADRLTKLAGVHNKYARIGLNLAGGVLGAGVAGSAAMPYLVGGTLAYAVGRKPFVWALNKVGATAGAIYDGVVGTPIGAVKGAYNSIINGFKNPTIMPQTSSHSGAAAH